VFSLDRPNHRSDPHCHSNPATRTPRWAPCNPPLSAASAGRCSGSRHTPPAIIGRLSERQHPSLSALQSLLPAAPLLSVRLEGPPSLERWLRHSSLAGFECSKGADFDPAVTAQWEALQHVIRTLPPRVAWVAVADE
jgi:hypothetical protein